MVIVDSPLADELAEIAKEDAGEPVGGPSGPKEISPEPESVAAEAAPTEAAPTEAAPTEAAPTAHVATKVKQPAADVRAMRSPDQRQEFARVDADLLDDLLNAAG